MAASAAEEAAEAVTREGNLGDSSPALSGRGMRNGGRWPESTKA